MARTQASQQLYGPIAMHIIAGTWLILSPFVLGFSAFGAPTWNAIVVGALLAISAAGAWIQPQTQGRLAWMSFVTGIWLVFSPFVLGYAALSTPLWNSVATGVLVLVLAAGSARSVDQPPTHAHQA